MQVVYTRLQPLACHVRVHQTHGRIAGGGEGGGGGLGGIGGRGGGLTVKGTHTMGSEQSVHGTLALSRQYRQLSGHLLQRMAHPWPLQQLE